MTNPLKKFQEFYELIKGRKAIKGRVAVLANPDNIKTTTILSRGQAKFCQTAHFIGQVERWQYKEGEKNVSIFEGLIEYAQELEQFSISVGGKGREQVIQFMGALSEGKLLGKLGLNVERGGAVKEKPV